MTLRFTKISWTTDTAGAATEYGDSPAGKLHAITYLPGTTDTGATVTVTSEGDMSYPLLVKASAGTSNITYYPRGLQHGNTDGAALTGTAGGDRTQLLVRGRLKVVIASGGAVKAGSVVIAVEQ